MTSNNSYQMEDLDSQLYSQIHYTNFNSINPNENLNLNFIPTQRRYWSTEHFPNRSWYGRHAFGNEPNPYINRNHYYDNYMRSSYRPNVYNQRVPTYNYQTYQNNYNRQNYGVPFPWLNNQGAINYSNIVPVNNLSRQPIHNDISPTRSRDSVEFTANTNNITESCSNSNNIIVPISNEVINDKNNSICSETDKTYSAYEIKPFSYFIKLSETILHSNINSNNIESTHNVDNIICNDISQAGSQNCKIVATNRKTTISIDNNINSVQRCNEMDENPQESSQRNVSEKEHTEDQNTDKYDPEIPSLYQDNLLQVSDEIVTLGNHDADSKNMPKNIQGNLSVEKQTSHFHITDSISEVTEINDCSDINSLFFIDKNPMVLDNNLNVNENVRVFDGPIEFQSVNTPAVINNNRSKNKKRKRKKNKVKQIGNENNNHCKVGNIINNEKEIFLVNHDKEINLAIHDKGAEVICIDSDSLDCDDIIEVPLPPVEVVKISDSDDSDVELCIEEQAKDESIDIISNSSGSCSPELNNITENNTAIKSLSDIQQTDVFTSPCSSKKNTNKSRKLKKNVNRISTPEFMRVSDTSSDDFLCNDSTVSNNQNTFLFNLNTNNMEESSADKTLDNNLHGIQGNKNQVQDTLRSPDGSANDLIQNKLSSLTKGKNKSPSDKSLQRLNKKSKKESKTAKKSAALDSSNNFSTLDVYETESSCSDMIETNIASSHESLATAREYNLFAFAKKRIANVSTEEIVEENSVNDSLKRKRYEDLDLNSFENLLTVTQRPFLDLNSSNLENKFKNIEKKKKNRSKKKRNDSINMSVASESDNAKEKLKTKSVSLLNTKLNLNLTDSGESSDENEMLDSPSIIGEIEDSSVKMTSSTPLANKTCEKTENEKASLSDTKLTSNLTDSEGNSDATEIFYHKTSKNYSPTPDGFYSDETEILNNENNSTVPFNISSDTTEILNAANQTDFITEKNCSSKNKKHISNNEIQIQRKLISILNEQMKGDNSDKNIPSVISHNQEEVVIIRNRKRKHVEYVELSDNSNESTVELNNDDVNIIMNVNNRKYSDYNYKNTQRNNVSEDNANIGSVFVFGRNTNEQTIDPIQGTSALNCTENRGDGSFRENWMLDRESYYNESWGEENYDVENMRNNMSRSPSAWEMPLDMYSSGERNRLYIRCTNCRQLGHKKFECPRPKKACGFCGRNTHKETKCPLACCLNCLKPNPNGDFINTCGACYNSKKILCHICKERGHNANRCPSIWRRYHSTVAKGPPNASGNDLNINKKRNWWCSGCARRGHLSSECNYFKYKADMPINSLFTNNYEDVYEGCPPAKKRKIDFGTRYNKLDPWSIHQTTYDKQNNSFIVNGENGCKIVPLNISQIPKIKKHKIKKNRKSKSGINDLKMEIIQVNDKDILPEVLNLNGNENLNNESERADESKAESSIITNSPISSNITLPSFIPLSMSNDTGTIHKNINSLNNKSVIQDNTVSNSEIGIETAVSNFEVAKIIISNEEKEKLLKPEGSNFIKDAKEQFGVNISVNSENIYFNYLRIEGTLQNQYKIQRNLRQFLRNDELQADKSASSNTSLSNIPKKVGSLIIFISKYINKIIKFQGDPSSIYDLALAHTTEIKRVSAQTNFYRSNKKKRSVRFYYSMVNKLIEQLNIILFGKAELEDGKKHLAQLKNSVKELERLEYNEIVTNDKMMEISASYQYFSTARDYDKYQCLINTYMKTKLHRNCSENDPSKSTVQKCLFITDELLCNPGVMYNTTLKKIILKLRKQIKLKKAVSISDLQKITTVSRLYTKGIR